MGIWATSSRVNATDKHGGQSCTRQLVPDEMAKSDSSSVDKSRMCTYN